MTVVAGFATMILLLYFLFTRETANCSNWTNLKCNFTPSSEPNSIRCIILINAKNHQGAEGLHQLQPLAPPPALPEAGALRAEVMEVQKKVGADLMFFAVKPTLITKHGYVNSAN